MRIGLISTVCTPVRRDHAGSVETIVWLLARELVKLGHDVSVFGADGSECDGTFIPTLPGSYGDNGAPDDWMVCEWINLSRALAQSGQFDVIHSHVYTWGIPLHGVCRCPMLNTLHILPFDDDATIWRLNPQAHVSAISRYQWSAYEDLMPTAIVPHGVDVEHFSFGDNPHDYVVYLGRFIENKGPLEAIACAKKAGVKIKLAGPRNDYFDAKIAPLVDGRSVEYVGAVDAQQRDELLRHARALVYPLREPEPFGLVQIESMLCGTPVAALSVGAVPEIVDEGVTGTLAKDIEDLPGALARATSLDRRIVFERASQSFTSTRMARDYAAVYERIIMSGRAVSS